MIKLTSLKKQRRVRRKKIVLHYLYMKLHIQNLSKDGDSKIWASCRNFDLDRVVFRLIVRKDKRFKIGYSSELGKSYFLTWQR
jgi:hypothetical protein